MSPGSRGDWLRKVGFACDTGFLLQRRVGEYVPPSDLAAFPADL
jgi:hypothetical protein